MNDMPSSVVATVNFMGSFKLLSLTENTNYSDFRRQISGTWPELDSSNFSCSFSVGNVVDCFLGCEDDLKNLVSLCKHTSQFVVVVDVIKIAACPSFRSRIDDHIESNNSPPSPVFNSCGPSENLDHEFSENFDSISGGSRSKPKKYCGNKRKVGNVINEVEFSSISVFDVCPIEKKKSYISDAWAFIMKDGTGVEFRGGAPEFRQELIKYMLKLEYQFKYVRNDSRYIHAVCKDDRGPIICDWFIKAKKRTLNDHFVVYRSNLIHRCPGSLTAQKKTRLGTSILSSLVIDKVKSNPTISGKTVMELFNHGYGFDIPYWKAWRSIESARNDVFGGYYESYDQLRWYCEAIRRTNPGSLAEIEKDNETNRFERLFVSFKASMDGFHHCRPLLFIDGTFLKGRAKGTMLTATAKDGDNGLFPVAYGIVSSENKENWKWFLIKLRDFISHDKQIMFISDRHPGLMSAFDEVFHTPVHFFCLFHLLQNLKTKFSSGWTTTNREELSDLFTECAYAPTRSIFHEKVAAFIEIGGKVAEEWIDEMPYDKWAISYSPNFRRYGEMTSNTAESFNSWISEARSMPITFMIDSIRKGICRWFVERREASGLWTGSLCATKEALWHHLSDVCKSWNVAQCPNGQFEVSSSVSVCVDLAARHCSCFQWQIRGFPCAHAVAVIRKFCTSAFTYIDDCYLTSNYRLCYKADLRPVPETERFRFIDSNDEGQILPPILNNPPGRPKKMRVRSFTEFRRIKPIVCARCGKSGRHDSFTCSQR